MEINLGVVPTPLDTYNNLIKYLHHLSNQDKEERSNEHSYSRPWNRHPDPNVRALPAKFLFMKDFPKHFALQRRSSDDVIDIVTVEEKPYETGENPLITEINALSSRPVNVPFPGPGLATDDVWGIDEKNPPNKNGWTPTMFKLWTKSMKILNSDRLARLTAEGKSNDVIIRRNILEKTVRRLRQLFAGVAQWDERLCQWLHQTLHKHVTPAFLMSYHEAMQLLRQKIPSLVDRFYQSASRPDQQRPKMIQPDPIQTVLNNHRPKRVLGSPLFLIVPNGPQIPHHFTSQRMKHWNNLFGSLGKVITVSVSSKTKLSVSDCLMDIRFAVRDKIRECKSTFTDARPLVIVGFGASSLIAAHAALDHAGQVTATLCIGFPLTGISGFRGDLDDPLLDTTVPTLFVIGQNSSMCTLDDMEDFRERMTKALTGLVVVGACNDRLILCGAKKRAEGLTQGMIDRCVADEIYDFVSHVIAANQPAATVDYMSRMAEIVHRHSHGSGASSSTHRPPPTPKTPTTPKSTSPPKPSHTSTARPSVAPATATNSTPRNTLAVPGVVKRKRKYPRAKNSSVNSQIGSSISAPPTVPSSPDPPPQIIDDAPLNLPPPSTKPELPPAKTTKRPRTSSDSRMLTPSALSDALSAVSNLESAKASVTETPAMTGEKTSETKTPAESTSSTPSSPPPPPPSAVTPSHVATQGTPTPETTESAHHHERTHSMSYGVAPVTGVLTTSSTRTRTIRAPKQLDI